MYELIIVWYNGDKNIYTYESREEAEKSMAGMKMAFGEQITWMGINPKHFWSF